MFCPNTLSGTYNADHGYIRKVGYSTASQPSCEFVPVANCGTATKKIPVFRFIEDVSPSPRLKLRASKFPLAKLASFLNNGYWMEWIKFLIIQIVVSGCL